MNFLKSMSDFLAVEDPPASCDVIAVLAGPVERKSYGLELFRRSVAPRLVLSVARFDVGRTAALLHGAQELIALRDKTPAQERHFWVDYENARRTIVPARLPRTGTFGELQALASYLAPYTPEKIALVSTSIHLRRIRFCCSRIAFFAQAYVSLLAVPESDSSFRRNGWWMRSTDCHYLLSEYAKLLAYRLLY